MGALFYVACDAQQAGLDAPSGIEQSFPDGPPNGLVLPEDSEIWEETVDGKSTVWFRLPETHALLGLASGDGTLHREPGGGITCTCTEGSGGCSPFRASRGDETIVGCAMDPDRCSSCDMSARTLDTGDGSVALEEVALIDTRRPVKVVETFEEAEALSCGKASLLADPEVARAVAEFVAPLQGPDPEAVRSARLDDDTDDVLTAPFDVFGHLMWLPIRMAAVDGPPDPRYPPSELMWARYVETEETQAREVPGDGPCTCNSGGGGCTHRERSYPFVGGAEWCEASSCNSCTLH